MHKLLDMVLVVAGFWILCMRPKIGIHEYKELDALNTFISFMIPIVYLILIILLEYILELYSKNMKCCLSGCHLRKQKIKKFKEDIVGL